MTPAMPCHDERCLTRWPIAGVSPSPQRECGVSARFCCSASRAGVDSSPLAGGWLSCRYSGRSAGHCPPFPLHPFGGALKFLAGELRENFRGRHRPYRLDAVKLIEGRRGAIFFLPRNLLRERLQILGGVGRNKQLGLFPVPGQRDIGRRAAPMFRVVEVRLIEGVALPFPHGAGIAMAEVIETRGVEIDGLAFGAGEPDGKVGAVDCLDDAGHAVFDANPPVGAGELHAVAGAEVKAAVRRLRCCDPAIPARRAPS